MIIRSARERLLQTLLFETGGLLVAAPLYQCVAGSGIGGSLELIAVISLVVMLWSPLHNTIFDALEYRLTRRVASDRPQPLRLVHAASHELTSMLVSLPVILAMTMHDLLAAMALDLGLSAVYTLYAFVFHNLFDRWRPVCPRAAPRPAGRRGA